ncbi:MAG TPA: hypothetical protein VH497_07565 [Vicinamibacterales bacterium]|jgi:hypothetical protein
MSYDDTRDAEQLRVIDPSIDDFIDRYNNSNGPIGGAPRQTVFFFPGGMGSTLKRAKKPYVDAGPPGQMFDYRPVWLTFEDFLGEVLDIAITKVGAEYRDKDNRIIVADGTVDILGWTFYDGFTEWCESSGLDYFVVGWDFRRRLEDSGEFFITQFLPYFQERVRDGCNNADPLANFSLIGHSAGGMVVNWILRESDDYPILSTLQKAITVATPFYGYAGQLHRWFEGDSYFNWDPFVTKDDLVRVICSLPACYSWLFMEEQMFIDNQIAFANDAYPLTVYPSKDKTTASVVADPYHPLMQGGLGRYPLGVGFDSVELVHGGALVRYLASSLDTGLAAKFFNIRGDDGKNDTVGSTSWNWVPPTDPSPIADVLKVAGDDTQPAWSARHLDLLELDGHVITVTGSTVSHMMTMFSPETLAEIGDLLGVVPVMAKVFMRSGESPRDEPSIATPEEAAEFVVSLQAQFHERPRSRGDRKRLRKYLAQFSNERLRRVMRRAMVSLVQHQGPVLPGRPRYGE